MHSQGITLSSAYLIIILSVHNNDVHNKFVHYRIIVYRNKYKDVVHLRIMHNKIVRYKLFSEFLIY